MATNTTDNAAGVTAEDTTNPPTATSTTTTQPPRRLLRFWRRDDPNDTTNTDTDGEDEEKERPPTEKWTMGILNDKFTEEVPGTFLLLSSHRNEPLGLRHRPARESTSSLPSPYPPSSIRNGRPGMSRRSSSYRSHIEPIKKKTADGQITLDPQPEDSLNDPLNWPAWRRDAALLSLGFYCMIGGGMTPILAAGFSNVASTFGVTVQQVSYTTGLYMMGMGLGSVIASPTAVLYGKRPVYLVSGLLFILASIWCALSPDYPSLVVARIVQGMAVSPVECLPSATIAEIFFLHERAWRIGIYTLLLLSGKNLVPLVSAAIIQTLGWRWLFWIVAIIVGFGLALLFLFVPETFWDRTPRPKKHHKRPQAMRTLSGLLHHHHKKEENAAAAEMAGGVVKHKRSGPAVHAHFAADEEEKVEEVKTAPAEDATNDAEKETEIKTAAPAVAASHSTGTDTDLEKGHSDTRPTTPASATSGTSSTAPPTLPYTHALRTLPPKTFKQTLVPWNGRLTHTSWLRVAIRPFILYAYPPILWSALVYSLSIGWLIVLSESVTEIFRSADTYNFTALQAGLVYISPFIGGVLGTAVAGRVSDVLVRFLAKRNGGVYEPEFRLLMAFPVAVSTVVGLMGYGWASQERDAWIVPTVFFGVISFGCSLGSTTAITYCVDCYRGFAGEALVTLNFSKNIFHGLVFSLFFVDWLESDGAKDVFIALGGIQLACLIATIPMYIYGKRARMWTVRKGMMEKF